MRKPTITELYKENGNRKMNKPNRQNDQRKAGNQPIPSVPEDNADISCAHSDSASEKNEQPQKRGILDRIKKTTSTDKITAFATFIIMIATTAYSVIALKQWKVMEKQTIVAQDSIAIAKATLEDARNSSEDQSARAERLTKANEKISDATDQSAKTMAETAKQSKMTLDSAIEHSRLDQRAWIGTKHIKPTEHIEGDKKVFIKEGERFQFQVIMTNTGKTPGRVLTTRVYLSVTEGGEKPKLAESAIIATEPTPFTIFPGAMRSSVDALSDVYSKKQIEAIKSGQYVLHVYGMTTYTDIFGQPHWTKFCDYLSRDLTSLMACPFYNETDDTQKTKQNN